MIIIVVWSSSVIKRSAVSFFAIMMQVIIILLPYTCMQAVLMTSPCVMLNTGKSWLLRIQEEC
ncbi:hypothetical protein I7I53_02248 [Histoplasma capsulatum var. duboisii H88]|uniref:Uncharacterized protein n=1 Tax=Ajellomyces capsulatus (strain H88) TaxID=544711 RepID=A0A8A1LMG2_AJEC8|nr:hypothetical protein I7I53_02248 [Histoplasma capsulatum var. duboisii H88]